MGTSEDKTLDAAEPPRIVFESAAECADRDHAEEVFRQGLASSRAPAPGWTITIRIEATTPPAVSAKADITNPSGTSLGNNTLAGDGANCAALGSAMSAWAADLLHAEVERTQPGAGPGSPPSPPAPRPVGAPGGADVCQVAPDAPGCQAQKEVNLALEAKQGRGDGYERPAREYEMPALELGVGPFFLVGGAAGSYAGITPFLIDEITEGVFLRPSLAFGESLATNVSSTWAVARLDTCARLPGRYEGHNGLQLDLCGGPDIGFSFVDSGTLPGSPPQAKTVPYVNLGPSVDLNGQVGRLAVSLRGVLGINIAREGFVDVTGTQIESSLVSWRLELDFSWALRR
jgi:hypothetical protein